MSESNTITLHSSLVEQRLWADLFAMVVKDEGVSAATDFADKGVATLRSRRAPNFPIDASRKGPVPDKEMWDMVYLAQVQALGGEEAIRLNRYYSPEAVANRAVSGRRDL